MFERLTTKRRDWNGRRAAWVAGSTAIQVACLAALIIASRRTEHKVEPQPPVPVRIVRMAPHHDAAQDPPPQPLGGGPHRRERQAQPPRGRAGAGERASARRVTAPPAIPGDEVERPPVLQPKAPSPMTPVTSPEPRPAPTLASPDAVASATGASDQAQPAAPGEGGRGGADGITSGMGGDVGSGGGAGGPVGFTSAMTPPVLIAAPTLEYTSEALDHRIEGTMVVRCVVTVAGAVRDCRVIRSVSFMDRAVVANLQQRRYRPATLEGRPVDVQYTFTIRLKLPRS